MDSNLPKKAFYGLLLLIFILLILHITAFIYAYSGTIQTTGFFFKKFNFDREKNIPSIFSSLLLLSASAILAYIGFSNWFIRIRKWFWWSISFLFLFLASDELLRIHEMVGQYISSSIETSGIFHYSWLIPYGIMIIILGFLCFKYVMELPRETKNRFIISGAIFLTGAVGFEMLAGWLIVQQGLENTDIILYPAFFTLYTIEELLEMTGVSLFIYSLLLFLQQNRIPAT